MIPGFLPLSLGVTSVFFIVSPAVAADAKSCEEIYQYRALHSAHRLDQESTLSANLNRIQYGCRNAVADIPITELNSVIAKKTDHYVFKTENGLPKRTEAFVSQDGKQVKICVPEGSDAPYPTGKKLCSTLNAQLVQRFAMSPIYCGSTDTKHKTKKTIFPRGLVMPSPPNDIIVDGEKNQAYLKAESACFPENPIVAQNTDHSDFIVVSETCDEAFKRFWLIVDQNYSEKCAKFNIQLKPKTP